MAGDVAQLGGTHLALVETGSITELIASRCAWCAHRYEDNGSGRRWNEDLFGGVACALLCER